MFLSVAATDARLPLPGFEVTAVSLLFMYFWYKAAASSFDPNSSLSEKRNVDWGGYGNDIQISLYDDDGFSRSICEASVLSSRGGEDECEG